MEYCAAPEVRCYLLACCGCEAFFAPRSPGTDTFRSSVSWIMRAVGKKNDALHHRQRCGTHILHHCHLAAMTEQRRWKLGESNLLFAMGLHRHARAVVPRDPCFRAARVCWSRDFTAGPVKMSRREEGSLCRASEDDHLLPETVCGQYWRRSAGSSASSREHLGVPRV